MLYSKTYNITDVQKLKKDSFVFLVIFSDKAVPSNLLCAIGESFEDNLNMSYIVAQPATSRKSLLLCRSLTCNH